MPSVSSDAKSDGIQETPSIRRTAVLLPCDVEHFTDFISGLLGKPQTIQTHFYNDFEIERIDIENLHHLVMQRVAQQNEAHLVQFTAKIIYNDKSSVLLNSFQEFVTYAEIRPLVPEEAVLTWIFLVRFQDKSHPEKQQIEITLDARRLNKTPGIFIIIEDVVSERETRVAENINLHQSYCKNVGRRFGVSATWSS